jgi:diguanylate cyclase (GGDEF)-like protein
MAQEQLDFDEELRKAQERKDRMQRDMTTPGYDESNPRLQQREADQDLPALSGAPPAAEQPAVDRSVIDPSFAGKSGGALSTLERVNKIQFLEQQQGALDRGEPLPEPGQAPSESNKGVWSNLKTTGKIAILYPIVGGLNRKEADLQMRQLTKEKVFEQLEPGDQAAIEEYAGKSIGEMRWAELDQAASRHFGHTTEEKFIGSNKVSVWKTMLDQMQGYTGEEKSMYTPGGVAGAGGQHIREDPLGEPSFGAAKELITGTQETESPLNFYEGFIRKKFSDDTPQLAEDGILAISELSKQYTEDTKASIEKPMVAEDAQWFNPLTYFDETTKDPYHDLVGFLHTAGQQMGNIGAMIVASKLTGRGGAAAGGRFAGAKATRTALQKAQRTGGRIGGATGGGATEMILIRDGVFSEANESVKNLPNEIWEEHEPYLQLVEDGLTGEEAKQVIAYQHANNAGDMAMVFSGVMLGVPMGAVYGQTVGRSAGRQLAKSSILKQMGKHAALESGQEASQEWIENLSGNFAKAKIDPNQDLFEGGLEAAVTGALISVGPGALGGIQGERGAGVSAKRDKLIRKTQGWVNAANERWKHQNKVGPNTSFAKDASSQDQLKAMLELERLQKKEADEFEKIKDDARELHRLGGNEQGLAEFDAMSVGYTEMRANIAKQQTRRSDSRKALRVEQKAARERADAVASVQRDVHNISDNLRLIENMNSVSRGEGLNQTGYEELVELGYGKYYGDNNENFVLTKRGRRAMPELQKQASDLHDKVNAGYTGPERRSDTQRRERIKTMLADPSAADTVERELYTDKQTGLRSRRAWDEEGADAVAVAVIDADSLKWVNDNMSHSAGTEFLEGIAKELRELGGSARSYRYGGDEFIVTADTEAELKRLVDAAMQRISNAGRIEEGGQSVEVSATVGFGTSFDAADNDLSGAKEQKMSEGLRADSRKGDAPPSFRTVDDKDAPQLTLFHYTDDMFDKDNPLASNDGYWEEYIKVNDLERKSKLLHVREVEDEHLKWINETVEEFLPGATNADNPKANLNNPPVTVAEDPNDLRLKSPRQYDELLDLGFSVWGVRGLFSLDDPAHGVFLIASNIIQAASVGLTIGRKIQTWTSARHSVEKGMQVELMSADGENPQGYGRIVEVKTVKYEAPKQSQKQKRLDNQISNKERQLDNLNAKHDRYLLEADFLTDEEYNNNDNELLIKLDDTFADLWDVRTELSDLRKKRSTTYVPYQAPDLSNDRIMVRMKDGALMEFDPNTNTEVNGETSLILGRVRGKLNNSKAKNAQWSYLWRANLGSKLAAEDEVLTKAHVREMVADTLMHETVGHYGIRGITKDYKTYERLTHSIVDAFPVDVKRLQGMGYKYRDEFSASQNKALLGEEIMAWRVGEIFGYQETMTPAQQTAVRKFITWLKELLLRLGYGKVYYGVKGARVRRLEAQLKEERSKYGEERNSDLINALDKRVKKIKERGFLTDADLQTIIARSHDYVRNGGQKWQFTGEDGKKHILPMRDSEIFRMPLKSVIMDETRELDENEMLPDTDQEPLPEESSIGDAYREATGNRMPWGFKLMQISDFKDEAKRLQKEGTRTNPKQLFDAAMEAAGQTAEDVEVMKQMSRIISTSTRERERAEQKISGAKAKHEKLVRLWGQDVVDNGKIPLYPEMSSIQGWLQATEDARKRGHTTKAEVEASGIDEAIWPSAIDTMIANIGSWNSAVFAEKTGITKKRVEELLEPATQMTKEEATTIARLIEEEVIPYPGVKPTAEALQFNNGLTVNDLSAWAISEFGSNQTDWMSTVFPEGHETRESYNKLREESQSVTNSIEDRQAAQRGMDDILASYISPTSLSLPKSWLLNAIKKPTYYYFSGDPHPPARNRAEIYKSLTGQDLPQGFDRHDEANAQIMDLINAEQELDKRGGPDIGYNPQTGTWYDPESDYSSDQSWESLRLPGIIPGTYRLAVFAQHPENDVRSNHMGFSNLQNRNMGASGLQGHMRGGMAYDGDPNPPTADNPANQGKAYTLSESQNDYGQAQTKHYGTQAEEQNARSLHKADAKALGHVYQNYMSGVFDLMLDPISSEMSSMNRDPEYLNDLIDLQFTPEVARTLTLQQKIAWAQIQKLRAIHADGIVDKIRGVLQSVVTPYNTSAARLSGMGDQSNYYESPEGLLGSDARLFEILDHKAIANMLYEVRNYTGGLRDEIEMILNHSSPEQLAQVVERGGVMEWLRSGTNMNITGSGYGNNLRNSIKAAARSGGSGNYSSYGFRFPWMRHESEAVLAKIMMGFDAAGFDATDSVTAAAEAKKIADKAFDLSQGSMTFNVMAISGEMGLESSDIKDILENWIESDGPTATGVTLQFENHVGEDYEQVRINYTGKDVEVKLAMPILRSSIQTLLNNHYRNRSTQQLDQAVATAESEKRRAIQRHGGGTRTDFRMEHEMEIFSLSQPYWSDDATVRHVDKNNNTVSETTVEEAVAIMSGHDVIGPAEYIKNAWKNAWPRLDDYDRNRFDEDVVPRDRKEKYLTKYEASKPQLIVGNIPVEWDSEGKPTKKVTMNIVRKRPGHELVLRIDGQQIETYADGYGMNRAYSKHVSEWYERNEIIPHPDSILGDQEIVEAETALSEAKDTRAAFDPDNIKDLESTDSLPNEPDQTGAYGDLGEVFERELEYHKRSGVQTKEQIQMNDQWRMTHIMHIMSDLTRRGIPRAFFHPGTATGARGGFFSNVEGVRQYAVKTDRIDWVMRKETLRGLERDIVVINSDELNEPLWIDVTNDKLIPNNPDRDVSGKDDPLAGFFSAELTAQLGRHVAEKIGRTMREVHKGQTEPTVSPERMLISQTVGGLSVLQNTNGDVIGTYPTVQEAETARSAVISGMETVSSLNLMKGAVTRGDIDMPIHILKLGYLGGGTYNLDSGSDYKHTVNRSTMEGARRNYDITFLKNLRAWIKPFGMTLEEGIMKIKSSDSTLATDVLGMPEVVRLPDNIMAQYPNIQVEEVTGQNYGWIVNTDNGLLLPNVFANEADAKTALAAWIADNRVGDDGFVKTWQITMNDKAKAHHKKSISPFVMPAIGVPGRPRKGTPLGEAYEKIGGSNEPRLIDRFNAWRRSWRASINVGMFDRLYGIRRAMDDVGQTELEAADDPYVQARMTTGLESIMRGILEFGHPVRRDGVIENEGEGLLKILEPVANDVELWAMYMAGTRSKRLMLEEYNRISLFPADDTKLKNAASHFEGRTFFDQMINLIAHLDNETASTGQLATDLETAKHIIGRLRRGGREKLFTAEQISAMTQLGEEFPVFVSVGEKYAAFNKKMLDFAESSGVINAETRPLWENADYIPFYRIVDERLVGPLAKGMGVANQNSPIKTLKGGSANLGDLVHNIFTNTTRLMDASIKNHAALMAIDALDGTGIINRQPHAFSKELIPMGQVKKILQQNGMDIDSMPAEVTQGLRVMFAVQPPTGPGVISILRDGKKEFWHTDDELLFRSLTAINMKAFGQWMSLLRAPKRLLTTLVTLDPGFMAANWIRDSMSAFVLSRDKFIPMAAGIKGFGQALLETETMRAMIGAGAAFDSGYINQGDPTSAQRMIKRAMKDKGFQATVLDTPRKLFNAWKRIGSATENANRIAVYDAAIRSGKSKAQAAYESKDLMDFSMGGDWPFIQFLIQTVPFMGARMQGLHRLGRGAAENPIAFTIKGALLSMAGMALWFAFRDDERYKDLEEWDKDTYFHWWVGDSHFRLPKGFEVGAIFNTIPERIFEFAYSNENDNGKLLLRRWGYMIAETFNMNPLPQALKPFAESYFNYNFFTGRDIESTYEENKLPPERYKYYTSQTMVELARMLPKEFDTASQKIRNPLHLQNFFAGWTGTLGRYAMMASDALVRHTMDYPDDPDWTAAQYPVIGRFIRGDSPRRTKYEDEFYRMLRTTIQVKGSLKALEEGELDARFDEIEREYAPYVDAAKPLERYRKRIRRLNAETRDINLDRGMSGAEKRKALDAVQKDKNDLYREAYELRPSNQPKNQQITQDSVQFLIENFNVNTPEANQDLKDKAPATAELVGGVASMPAGQLRLLEKSADYGGN